MKTLKRVSGDMYLIMDGENKVGSLQKGSGIKVVAHYNERYTCWNLLVGGKNVDSGSFDRMKKLALR